MTPEDDREFEEALRKVLQERLESTTVSSTFQTKVLETISSQHLRDSGRYRHSTLKRRLWFAPLWQSVAAVLLVMVIAYSGAFLTKSPGLNTPFKPTQMGTFNAASNTTMTPSEVVFGSFAAITTQNIQLVPDRHSSLSTQRFTVRCQLYNSSNTAMQGNDLRGMLFLLNRMGQLTPSRANDWEYFVNGPKQVISPHHAVTWSFSPNPAPPYTTLNDRYVHIVWFTDQTVTGAPNFVIHPLPIKLQKDRMVVYKVVKPGIQLLRIQATIQNQGSTPLSYSSLLGMLFFKTNATASLLSSATYRYFDDVVPLGKSSLTIAPGQSGQAQFEIVGVPGVDMTKLPITLLVVRRSDIGA